MTKIWTRCDILKFFCFLLFFTVGKGRQGYVMGHDRLNTMRFNIVIFTIYLAHYCCATLDPDGNYFEPVPTSTESGNGVSSCHEQKRAPSEVRSRMQCSVLCRTTASCTGFAYSKHYEKCLLCSSTLDSAEQQAHFAYFQGKKPIVPAVSYSLLSDCNVTWC